MHPAIARLHQDPRPRPLVAAHRCDSCHHAENTLTAFQHAAELGVAIQEFDVRELACGELVCVHDATLDRTSDASSLLGPGALIAHLNHQTVARLDAGSWHHAGAAREAVPTLQEALAVMLPTSVPLIEHKAGAAARYVEFLRSNVLTNHVILQSFDWQFLADVQSQAPEIALAALGPNQLFATMDQAAVAHAESLGVQMMHWSATELTYADVAWAHTRGLLVCSYTTDNELGWLGGRAMGLDAMCTNRPGAMIHAITVRSAR